MARGSSVPIARRALSSAVALTGLAILLLGLLLGAVAFRGGEAVADARWLLFVLGGAGITLGGWLNKVGRQIGRESGEAFLTRHEGAIVTYLRSFQADSSADKASGTKQRLITAVPQSLLTEEEQIALALDDVAPLVAIGRPGERLPQLGAYRVYSDDEHWQDVVRMLLDRSALVLMRAGETEGFWWEIAHVRETVPPERLAILLPRTRDEYERFRERCAAYFPLPLPDYEPGALEASFGGVLWFDPDYTPHIVTASHAITAPVRHAVAADLRRMLGGVYDNMGVEGARPAEPKERLKALGVDVALVAGFSLAGWLGDRVFGTGILLSLGFLVSFLPLLLIEMTPLRATPGKLIFGLRAEDAAGFPPRLPQMFMRSLLRFALLGLMGVGYASILLIALRKPALHDMVAGTDVFEKRRETDSLVTIGELAAPQPDAVQAVAPVPVETAPAAVPPPPPPPPYEDPVPWHVLSTWVENIEVFRMTDADVRFYLGVRRTETGFDVIEATDQSTWMGRAIVGFGITESGERVLYEFEPTRVAGGSPVDPDLLPEYARKSAPLIDDWLSQS